MQKKIIKIPFVLLLIPFLVRFFNPPGVNYALPQQEYVPIPENFKVAFIADQGLNEDSKAVLTLIKDEGAQMVLHQGDFDYENNPELWDQQINDILGPDFPYFASVGNHDQFKWDGYQQKLQERLERIPEVNCTGDLGVNSACYYKGLFFILSGVGTLGENHANYLREMLRLDQSIWRVCSWHKNQNAMQTGSQKDKVGWDPYEICRDAGAIIATAHEHTYARTRTLLNTRTQQVDISCLDDPSTPDADVCVYQGGTFVFHSGMAGKSIRNQDRCLPTMYPYGCSGEWAKIYTSDQDAQYGALFISFHVDGNPWKATAYFKNINGEIIDSFTISAEQLDFIPFIHR